jgi:hypothetical protein
MAEATRIYRMEIMLFPLIVILSFLISPFLFFVVVLMRPAKARRFVARSLYVLLPGLLLSLWRFFSLGERGFLDVSQALATAVVFFLFAEVVGLLISLLMGQVRAGRERSASEPKPPIPTAPKGPPPPGYYENPYAPPWSLD